MEKTYRPLYYNGMKLFEKERKLGECTFQCPWGGVGLSTAQCLFLFDAQRNVVSVRLSIYELQILFPYKRICNVVRVESFRPNK